MGAPDTIHLLGMRMSRRARTNFRWDFAAAVTFSLFNVVFNQFYIPIALRNGASDFQVGLLSAAPAIGLLFSPLWAGMSERGRALSYVIYPNLFGRLLIVIPALFTSPWVFVGIAVCFQLLMGIQAPAYATVMTQIYPAEIRGRLMGYVRVAMGLLMIPISYGVGLWIDTSGSLYPFLAASVAGVLSVSLLFMLQIDQDCQPTVIRKKRASLKEQFTILRGNRPLVLFLTATSLSGFGNLLVNPLYSIIQVEHLQLSNTDIGLVRIAYFVCLLLAYLVMGWVIDRFSPRYSLMASMACMMSAPLLYGIFGTYPAVLTASGLQGIADASWDLGCLAYVFRLAPGREGVVFGLHLMLFGIRGTIAPILGTGLNGILPIDTILYMGSIFALFGLISLVMNREKKQPDASNGISG